MFSIDGGSMKILSAKMAMTGKDDNPVAPGFDDSKWPEVRLGKITATADAAWNANWMTFPDENATLYFRKTVDLDADPAQGLICISVDNLYTLFVNGERAGGENDENGWRNAEVHNVTGHLRRGRNVIAVEARNLGGPGGVLLEGMIVLADGRRLKILSNNTWKVSPEADANWAKPDFDDSKWAPAQQGPRPPEGVWQEVAGLTPEIASGPSGTTWYRFVAPLVADALVLPGIVQEVYVGGKPVTVTDGRVKIEPSKLVALKCSDELPAPIICKTASAPTELKPWAALGIPRFSGSGLYQTTVKVPELRDGDELMLDLGDARIAAQVWVNDKQAGTRIWQPYRFRITRLVKPGENAVKVLVTNTLGNEISAFALSGGGQYDKMPPDRLTSGLLGPVQLQLYRLAR
jgi:(2Fe-2S) ferredoxin